MFVFTCKASTLKLFTLLTILCIAVVLCVLWIPTASTEVIHTAYLDDAMQQVKTEKTQDCIQFLKAFGWTVEETPCDTATVTIPAEFDRIFTAYNHLQLRQGMDLSRYKQKEVTRYTYRVTNYPDYNGTVYANLFVYKGKIIGGDICSADINGFLHGFSKPS